MDLKINEQKTLYLDCSSGISGDMTVAALLDLGADRKVLTDALESLPLDGYRIEITSVIKSGLQACDFHVILDTEHENHDHDMAYLHGPTEAGHTADDPDSHQHGHNQEAHQHSDERTSHHHSHTQEQHHHGRNLEQIRQILSAGRLTDRALQLALKIFQIVAEAESQVHGKPIQEVHFHEVGAVDSIVDIAATAVCIDNLGIQNVIIPFLTEGCGQVRCRHGLLPVPVPATTAILTAYQLPLHISSVQGELVTPTGAAIAAALRTQEQLPGEFKIVRTGLGAGKRSYETAGVLRAMLIEDAGTDYDRILMIETNMDDCTGEAMGFVMEELLAAGALDVFYTPIYMKKHRPAYQLSIMCAPEKRQAMEELIFRHTTTIGLRTYEVQRTKLFRKIISLETPWGMADVKRCQFNDEVYYYPESDSVLQLAKANQISFTEMYHEVKEYAAKNHSLL